MAECPAGYARPLMRSLLLPLAVLGASVALAAPAAAQQPQPACPDADVRLDARTFDRARAAVLCIVNAERTTRGLTELAPDSRLDDAARAHSRDMALRDYFDHVSPEGEGPDARVTRAGYPWTEVAENIALGQETPREVMQAWMASEGHCRGVLSVGAAELGVGMEVDRSAGPWWTQVFAREESYGPPPVTSVDIAAGCPFDRLSIQPGKARITLGRLSRSRRGVRVRGMLVGEDAGRRLVVAVRRSGRSRSRSVRTRAGGGFSVRVRPPRGRGKVRVVVTAPGVSGAYATGRVRSPRF